MRCDYCVYNSKCKRDRNNVDDYRSCFKPNKNLIKTGDTIYQIYMGWEDGVFQPLIEKGKVTAFSEYSIICNESIAPYWFALGKNVFKTYEEAKNQKPKIMAEFVEMSRN